MRINVLAELFNAELRLSESPVEKHVIVAEGNEMTLNCSFTSKPAPLIPGRPVIRWLRKGIVVKTETNSTNESVSIRNCRSRSRGFPEQQPFAMSACTALMNAIFRLTRFRR